MEVGKANGRNDAYGTWWNRRNTDLKYVLTAWQYEKFMDMNHFYKARPKAFVSYKGGNNKKSDRYYTDKKVNKSASTPTAKNAPTYSYIQTNQNRRIRSCLFPVQIRQA